MQGYNNAQARASYRVDRVVSGLDDLGHFFGGSSGSHLQAKLSGCDPDITCSLENSVHL